MTMTSPVSCPHCGASNPPGAAFCESCGKALPSATPAGPRVVTADTLPQTAIGHRMVGDELVKQQKKASTALLIVGILQITCGAVLFGIMSQAPRQQAGQVNMIVFATLFIVGAIFLGLYFWARRSPLPATIVGLILYATLVVINVVVSISALAENPDGPRSGFGGLGIGWLDIVIIVILVQAIGAGLKYKRLVEAQGGVVPVAARAPMSPLPPPPPPARGV